MKCSIKSLNYLALLAISLIICSVTFSQTNTKISGLNQLKNSKVYLLGERHDIVEKFDVQLELIKHLHQHNELGIIIFEHPYSYGLSMQHYFETGDSLYLKQFLNQQKGTSDPDINPKYQFYLNLYRYQKTLHANDTLLLEFIDQEFYTDEALQLLIQLLIKSGYSKSKEFIERLQYDPTNFKHWDLLKDTLNEWIEVHQQSFRHNSSEILRLNKGLHVTHRDSFLFSQVKQLLIQYPQMSIFGQFGANHVQKGNAHTMAALLNSDSASVSFQNVLSSRLVYQKIKNLPVQETQSDKIDLSIYRQNSMNHGTTFIQTHELQNYKKDYDGLIWMPQGTWSNILR